MKRKIYLLALGLALGLSACAKSPQQWYAYGQERAAAGKQSEAVAAFDKALAHPGSWAAEARLERARSLFALGRWPEAERGAESAANGQTTSAARPGLLLALQACAKDGDRPTGAGLLRRLGPQALADPAVKAAALALGLATVGPAAPVKTAAPERRILPRARHNGPISHLDAVRLGIGTVTDCAEPGPEFVQAARFIDPLDHAKTPSPDGRWKVWRGLDKTGYWLFLSGPRGRHPVKLVACKNGYQPVWSPDSRHILFSAMDWRTVERNLYILDLSTRRVRRAFKATHNVGPLAAWSPDGRKIVFTYAGNLWIMNSTGIGLALLDLATRIGRPVDDAAVIGFSRDGGSIIYRSRQDPICRVIRLAPRI